MTVRIPYQSPRRTRYGALPGQASIQNLVESASLDHQGQYPVLYTCVDGQRVHLAVPTALTCLGPRVAGLLVYNTETSQFEALSVVMDQRITHMAARNKTLDATGASGNAILHGIVMGLTEDGGDGVRQLGCRNVIYSGFRGFHIGQDPTNEDSMDLVLTLDDAVLLRFRLGVPGTPNSVLFRKRTYLVEAGSYFDDLPDISVDFHRSASPLYSLAWSVLPHVAIATHRRETHPAFSAH